MSVERAYVVRCDERVAILCHDSLDVPNPSNADAARALAASNGWITLSFAHGSDVRRDVCPTCANAIRCKELRRPKA